MNIDLTLVELEELDKLANKLDLSYENVLRQALRLYQSVDAGILKVVETNPLSKYICLHDRIKSCPGEEWCEDCGETLWID